MRALGLMLVLLAGAAPLFAQSSVGPGNAPVIQGEVTLPDGNPAPLIYLQLEPENGGGMIQSATTDSAGFYIFNQVGVGYNYTIAIHVQGFEPINHLVMVTDWLTVENFTLIPIPPRGEPKAGSSVPVQALKIPPKAWKAYLTAAREIDEGNDVAADRHLRQAIHAYPKFVGAFRKLSAVDANLGRFVQAEAAIHQAFKLQKNGESYAYLGYVYLQEKHDQKAQAAFLHSVRLSANDWLAQLELGRMLYDEKNYQDAYPHLALARKLRPEFRSTHLLLYDDLIQLNRKQEALAELDRFLKRFPKAPEVPKMLKMKVALEASLAHSQH